MERHQGMKTLMTLSTTTLLALTSLARAEDLPKPIADLERLETMEPNSLEAQLNLGRILYETRRDLDAARRHLMRALTLNPDPATTTIINNLLLAVARASVPPP